MKDWLAFFLFNTRPGPLQRWADRRVRTWFGGLT